MIFGRFLIFGPFEIIPFLISIFPIFPLFFGFLLLDFMFSR